MTRQPLDFIRAVRRLALAFLCVLPVAAQAQQTNQGPVFTVLEENDLVVRTDRHYTQGIKLAYFHSDNFLPRGAGWLYTNLPTWSFESQVGKFGYQIGQSMYTPANITSPAYMPDDRPYAGWLYTGFILHRRGVSDGTGWPILESFELQLGIIGSGSLAEEAQTWVHQMRGFDLPQGWSHQLRNELGIALRYQRSARLTATNLHPLDLQFIPHAGFSLGNVETSARVGGQVRLGLFLPDDYGLQTIDALVTSAGGYSHAQQESRWGIYVFAGSEGRAVLHNAFLDGNLFSDSHSVDKEYFVGDFSAGCVLVCNRLEVGYTRVWRSPEFHNQTEHDSFGSFFVKLKF